MENLARYIIYPEGHKQERMQYLDQEGKVVYTSTDVSTSKSFPALCEFFTDLKTNCHAAAG
jgi:hypothetical protein